MTKMLPVRYKSYIDRIKPLSTTYIPIEMDDEKIKEYIHQWLFVDKYDYVLIFYKNELWLTESDDRNSESYCKKKIEYHPLQRVFVN